MNKTKSLYFAEISQELLYLSVLTSVTALNHLPSPDSNFNKGAHTAYESINNTNH